MKKVVTSLLSFGLIASTYAGTVSAVEPLSEKAVNFSSSLISENPNTTEAIKRNKPTSRLSANAEWQEVEPNDIFEDADLLPLDDFMFGKHNSEFDEDYFSITVPQNGSLQVGIGSNPYSETLSDIDLINSNGDVVDFASVEETEIGFLYNYRIAKGEYYIVAYEIDGWESTIEDFDYTLAATYRDTIPPKVPIINRVDDNDTVVTGTAELGANVYLFKSGVLFRQGKADSSGNYSFNIPILKAGTGLSVQVKDAAGNKSPIAYTRVKDRTAPLAPVISVYDDNDTSVIGTAEPLSTVTVYNGEITLSSNKTLSDGTFSVSVPFQKAGTVINVTVTDAAGYVSPTATTTVIDKTAPRFSRIFPLLAGQATATGKTEHATQVVIKRGNSTVGKGWSNANGYFYVPIIAQPKGTKLTYYVRDSANNTSTGFKLIVQ